MDCLYHATVTHAQALDLPIVSFQTWLRYKLVAGHRRDEYVMGGVAPWLVRRLVNRPLRVQHQYWEREHYHQIARWYQKPWIRRADFMEYGITLAPAIYLHLDQHHAFYAEEVPEGNVVMAIQIQEE